MCVHVCVHSRVTKVVIGDTKHIQRGSLTRKYWNQLYDNAGVIATKRYNKRRNIIARFKRITERVKFFKFNLIVSRAREVQSALRATRPSPLSYFLNDKIYDPYVFD